MASITINVAPTINSGTVSVYAQANWPYGTGFSGAPIGSVVTTGTVDTSGAVTLSGLTASTSYVAYQASPDRYLRFMVPKAASSGGGSAITQASAAVTSSQTVTANTSTPFNAAAGALTATLPTGATAGSVVVIEKYDSTSNTVTISGSIRGSASTIVLSLSHETVEFVADSAGSWWPVAGHKTLTSLDARLGGKATYECPRGYLDTWDAALATAGSSLVEATIIGDSTTFGQTTTGSSGFSANNYSIVTKLRALSIAGGYADGGAGFRSYYDSASMNPVDNVNAFLQFTRTDAGVGTTSGSNVVTDTAVLATDIGRKVTFSAGFGAAGFIGSVTPGTSFTVVTASGGSTALNATSTTSTSVTVTGDGFTDAAFSDNGPLAHYDATAANLTQTGFTTVMQGFGTTCRLGYIKQATGGTFTYSVDGGTAQTVNTVSGSTNAAYVTISGLSAGVQHTITVTVTVAGLVTVWPEWVNANGLVWHKEGVPGQKLITRIPSAPTAYSLGAGVGTLVANGGLTNAANSGPRNLKLACLNMGLNDMAQAASQTDAINKAQQIETAVGIFAGLCRNAGIPGVVCLPHFWYFTNALLYAPLFKRALVTAARSYGLAWIDLGAALDPVTNAATYTGSFGTQPHLNQLGYDTIASYLWNNLLKPGAPR